jgi:predicted amidophosphoribosyltransferase
MRQSHSSFPSPFLLVRRFDRGDVCEFAHSLTSQYIHDIVIDHQSDSLISVPFNPIRSEREKFDPIGEILLQLARNEQKTLNARLIGRLNVFVSE